MRCIVGFALMTQMMSCKSAGGPDGPDDERGAPRCGSPASDAGADSDNDDDLEVVKGVVASETQGYFEDPDVQAVFAGEGLDVQVEPAGSRQIATSVNLDDYAFALPSNLPAAQEIQRTHNIQRAFEPFHSPMAIASFQSVVEILADEGIATKADDGTWRFDMREFMGLAAEGAQWDELGHDGYAERRDILISATDPRRSNAGGMYLSLTSYLANGDSVVASGDQERAVLPAVVDLFVRQGQLEPNSGAAFDKWLSQGIGFSPLHFVYEAQYLEQLMRDDSRLVLDGPDASANRVLLYPSPSIVSTHTLVPLDEKGRKVGKLLMSNSRLQRLAARHGFRTSDADRFDDVAERCLGQGFTLRQEAFGDVAPGPAVEVLNRLIDGLDEAYRSGGTGGGGG